MEKKVFIVLSLGPSVDRNHDKTPDSNTQICNRNAY